MEPDVSEELDFDLFDWVLAPRVIKFGLHSDGFVVRVMVTLAFDLEGADATSCEAA